MIKAKQAEVKVEENNVLEDQNHFINLHFQVVKLFLNKNNLKYLLSILPILNITNTKIKIIPITETMNTKHHTLSSNKKNKLHQFITKSIQTEWQERLKSVLFLVGNKEVIHKNQQNPNKLSSPSNIRRNNLR